MNLIRTPDPHLNVFGRSAPFSFIRFRDGAQNRTDRDGDIVTENNMEREDINHLNEKLKQIPLDFQPPVFIISLPADPFMNYLATDEREPRGYREFKFHRFDLALPLSIFEEPCASRFTAFKEQAEFPFAINPIPDTGGYLHRIWVLNEENARTVINMINQIVNSYYPPTTRE